MNHTAILRIANLMLGRINRNEERNEESKAREEESARQEKEVGEGAQ